MLIFIKLAFIHFRALNNIGIDDVKSYKYGNWFGNSSLDGMTIFTSVTYNLSDLIETLTFKYENEETLTFTKTNFHALKPRTIGDINFGRCFEANLVNDGQFMPSVQFTVKKSIYIYVNIPFHYYTLSRSKLQVNVNEYLYLDINYEIMNDNNGKSCRKYSDVQYLNSYDWCVSADVERRIKLDFNCTIPFLVTIEQKNDSIICKGETAQKALNYFQTRQTECLDSCHNMITGFGFPFITRQNNSGTGFGRLYFKKIVKETEDFVSYDFLRFLIILWNFIIYFIYFIVCAQKLVDTLAFLSDFHFLILQ